MKSFKEMANDAKNWMKAHKTLTVSALTAAGGVILGSLYEGYKHNKEMRNLTADQLACLHDAYPELENAPDKVVLTTVTSNDAIWYFCKEKK